MCGFSSYFHFDNQDKVYPNLDLETSLQYIEHRGPDSKGKYISPCGRCALGHVRLSIIDLAGGQQPLFNETDDIHAVVNGELYDFERIRGELEDGGHTFKTKSDSEIALHLYETYDLSFFDYLRGEFALNIWDAKKNLFIAARDRFGIKPLYYTVCNGTLLVASEIKAFIPMGWKPEWDVDSLINNGPMFDNRTCFKNVFKVPAAHYLIAASSGFIDIQSYWDADYSDKNIKETRTVKEMVEGVRERLIEAVRYRLRADVPIGVYLSGGIDSSSIAGIASKLLRDTSPDAKIRAFSISFVDGDKYDESATAERTAKFCNAEFEKLSLTEDDLLNSFEESIWFVEQPHFNLNGVGKFLLSNFVRDQGYKVVLTGEGSDEHFAGYAFFHGDYLREADNASPNGFGTMSDTDRKIKSSLLGKQGELSIYMMDNDFIQDSLGEDNIPCRKMLNNISTHMYLSNHFCASPRYFSDDIVSQYGEPDIGLAIAEYISPDARFKANTKWHPLHTALYVENHTLLPNCLCNMLGDRCELAHSIEGRTPFLDHPLCEYVNSLPPSLKIKSEENGSLNEKWILKEAIKPYITEEIYNRTKHPFMAPSSKAQNPVATNLINKLITKENVYRLGWADFKKIAKAKDAFFNTGDNSLFKDLLILMGYLVISQRFNVATHDPTTKEKHYFTVNKS